MTWRYIANSTRAVRRCRTVFYIIYIFLYLSIYIDFARRITRFWWKFCYGVNLKSIIFNCLCGGWHSVKFCRSSTTRYFGGQWSTSECINDHQNRYCLYIYRNSFIIRNDHAIDPIQMQTQGRSVYSNATVIIYTSNRTRQHCFLYRGNGSGHNFGDTFLHYSIAPCPNVLWSRTEHFAVVKPIIFTAPAPR